MEYHYSDNCPECKSRNYWSGGDPTDLSGIDVEGIKCWKCKKKWLLEGSEEYTTMEDANFACGEKRLD